MSPPHIVLMIGDDGIVVVPFKIADASAFFVPLDDKRAQQELMTFLARHPKATDRRLASPESF